MNIQIGALNSASFGVSAEMNEMHIEAFVSINNQHEVQEISNGSVMSGENVIASFSVYANSAMNVNTMTANNVRGIFDAIAQFIDDVRSQCTDLTLEIH